MSGKARRKLISYFIVFVLIGTMLTGNIGLPVVRAAEAGEGSEIPVAEEDSEEKGTAKESEEASEEESTAEESEEASEEESTAEESEEVSEEESTAEESEEVSEEESTVEESEEASEEESTAEESEEASEEESISEVSAGEEVSEELIAEQEVGATGVVTETDADIRVIPDKYNTGCNEEVVYFPMDTENPMMIGDVLIIPSGGGSTFVLDFGYRNKEITGTVYIENYDFTDAIFRSYHEDLCDREIKVVFNNCKFTNVLTGRAECNISYEYNNCSFDSFSGSNAVFNRCQFGHTYKDGIVPFVDVEVNDCFFTDFTGMVTDSGAHIDGTQLYGIEGIDVSRVYYNNCRFEMPALALEGTTAYVNACIMLQLEYSSGNNIQFNDCRVNGGGYTVYAESKFENLTFENVKFDGLTFGDANKFGIFYPKINENIEFRDIGRTDSLYIGSVWNDEKGMHLSVTNDTKEERILVVQTDKGIYEYTIPACYTAGQFTNTMLYEEFPFDLDIVIPADCTYAVCYDNTTEGFGKQIRFVNESGKQVILSPEMKERVEGKRGSDILQSGMCGKDISFTLTYDGVLTLSGTGASDNFHSQKFPEWVANKGLIKEIIVEEGVTGLGNMIFRDCMSVEKISLPESLLTIGGYAFAGCVGLEEFAFPKNIQTIGASILSGTVLSRVTYDGYDEDWDWVEVGSGNDNWLDKLEVARVGLRVRLAERDASYVYTGSAIEPDIVVFNNKERLVKGVDYTVKYVNNVKASTEKKPAKIIVTGKGNLTGSNSATFQILPKDINDSDVVAGSVVVVKASKAKPVLTYNNRTLGTADYTIAEPNKKYTEDGTVMVTGKGNFTGTREIAVKVTEKKAAKKFSVIVQKEVMVYNGKSQKPLITVKDKTTNEVLKEKKDYSVVYAGNTVNAGTVKFTVVGLGAYSGAVNKTYQIKPLAVKDASMVVSGINEKGYDYTPKGATVEKDLKITYNGAKLVYGTDYKITYSNNKKLSTAKNPAKYTVSFMGNYKGSTPLKGTFMVKALALTNTLKGLEIVVGDKIYTGKPGTYVSKPIVTVQGVQLKASEYKVTYYKDAKLTEQITSKNKLSLEDGTEYVTVYMKIVGKGNYATSDDKYAKAEYRVCQKPAYDLAKARVTLWQNDKKITKAEYTGLAIEPTVKVEVKNGKVWEEVPAEQYRVYYTNNINKGTATVTVTAQGESYAGSKAVKFKIVAQNIKSLKDLLKDLFGL